MYRRLSQREIRILELRGCSADNWDNVEVKDPFFISRLKNVKFSGAVKLGANSGKTNVYANIIKPAGITDCYVQDCVVGDNVYLNKVGSAANYIIGDNVAIENVGILSVTGKTTFGNGHEIDILNESGGRELPVFDKLSAQIAYLIVVYRHNKSLIQKLKSLVANYVRTKESEIGVIGEEAKILYSQRIINVNIGPCSIIFGASRLEEGTIKSNRSAPVFIGEGVIADKFIVLSGSNIDSGAILTSTFIGQGVNMGKQFSSENSAFFANCEAYHGEACSIFAGPYSVTHHKLTLLIAGLFSFYNAGSGTNQSNHMYKLGPVHQGIVERGSKTGSFSYLLWPCRIGAFSVVMDKHDGNFDTSDFPFSYISVENGKSILTPAMNLFTVGTARDSEKWPKRDRRTDEGKADLINFEIFNPYTIQKMITGSGLLNSLHQSAPKNREMVYYKGVNINRLMLRTSKRYYDLAIKVYLYGELVNRLANHKFKNITGVRKILAPEVLNPKQNQWLDLAGMIIDKEVLNNIIELLSLGKLETIENLQTEFQNVYNEYDERVYSWCVAVLKNEMGIDIGNITVSVLTDILNDWKDSSIKFNNIILKDAGKEFDQLSRIGFGTDGDEDERDADFEAIRGKYETNSFITGIQKRSKEIEKLFLQLSENINNL
jgi:hypothetical protein